MNFKVQNVNFSCDYPFGWVMPGRELVSSNKYRFGYQGEFSEKDVETGWNQFELGSLDTRVGRRMSPDPAGQYFSPYMAVGNNPVRIIDKNGAVGEDTKSVIGDCQCSYIDDNGNYITEYQDYSQMFEFAYDYYKSEGYDLPEIDFSTVNSKIENALNKNKHLDIIGIGASGEFTFGGGAAVGIEFIYFLDGIDKGLVVGYVYVGGNSGVTVGAGVYGLSANFIRPHGDSDLSLSNSDYLGIFNSYSAGAGVIGGNFFWGNSNNKVKAWPGSSINSKVTWEGIAVGYTPTPAMPGAKFGLRWCFAKYSYLWK